jgi:hypothetical protein
MRIKMLLAGGLMLLGQHAVQAHDYNNDLGCGITMNNGAIAYWSFAPNSSSTDGAQISTVVETGYIGNGKTVTNQPGQRPVWIMTHNSTGYWLVPRATPGYALHEDTQKIVTFVHGNNILGVGRCQQGGPAGSTAGTIPDQAPE